MSTSDNSAMNASAPRESSAKLKAKQLQEQKRKIKEALEEVQRKIKKKKAEIRK